MAKTRLLALLSTSKRTSPIAGVLALLSRLPRDQYEITIATLSSEPEENLKDAFVSEGFRYVCLGLDGARRWLPGRTVKKLIRAERPDILYTTGLRPDLFGGRAAHRCRVPVLVSMVCNIPPEDYRNLYGPVASALVWWRQRRAFRRYFTRVAPLATRMAVFLRSEWIPSEKLHVILNGADFSGFSPPTAAQRAAARDRHIGPHTESTQVCAFVGEMHRLKGVYDLLEAARELRDERPDLHWLLIGTPTEQKQLEIVTEEYGLGDRVHFTGHISDVPGALAAADVFVHASHSEGLSRAVLEAMAVALPIVATDVSGTRDIIPSDDFGRVVAPKQPRALAQTRRSLLSDPELLAAIGERGRTRVLDHFNADRMAAEYHELFTHLLRERSTSTA